MSGIGEKYGSGYWRKIDAKLTFSRRLDMGILSIYSADGYIDIQAIIAQANQSIT
jgi:hypothetical protein